MRRLLVCLTILTCLSTAHGDRRPTGGSGSTSGDKPPESDERVDANKIQGFTEPYADISMAASEMGTLAEVLVQDGDVVKSGQLLARLDDAVLRASLAVAKTGMKAEGELLTATTQLDLKKVELQKLSELFQRNHASQKELDRVRGEVKIAEARVQSVREDLEIRRLEYARIEAQLNRRQIR